MSRFFCLYIAEFPAWVAMRAQPKHTAVPLAVHHRGRIVAACPLAREAGVGHDWTVARTQSRCPLLRVVPYEPLRCAVAWDEILSILYNLTPRLEPLAQGLVMADLDPRAAISLVRAWGARCGAGGDRATAHLAALSADAGAGLTVVPRRSGEFADEIPISLLMQAGLSSDTVERLAYFGWNTLGPLRFLSQRQLEEQVGPDGEVLWRYARAQAHPENRRPVPNWTPPPVVAQRLSFEEAAREPAEWESALDELLRRAADALEGRAAHSLEVTAETPVGLFCSRRLLREPSREARALERPARQALADALSQYPGSMPMVKSLKIKLRGLSKGAAGQRSLFEGTGFGGIDPEARKGRIDKALKGLERRFPGAVGHFSETDPHTPFPEDRFGWLPAIRGKLGGRFAVGV